MRGPSPAGRPPRGLRSQISATPSRSYAAALGKPIVTLHDEELTHSLKEIDRAAMATAQTPEQVVDVLRYVLVGELPARV